MHSYVISPEQAVLDEIRWISALLDAGVTAYHLRKPSWTREELARFLRQVPAEARQRIVLHQHHELVVEWELAGYHFKDTESFDPNRSSGGPEHTQSRSLHRIQDLATRSRGWDYVFLSPVFPSISKSGYQSDWSDAELKTALERARADTSARFCALGGVNRETAAMAQSIGFDAIVLHGALWQSSDPVYAYQCIQEVLS